MIAPVRLWRRLGSAADRAVAAVVSSWLALWSTAWVAGSIVAVPVMAPLWRDLRPDEPPWMGLGLGLASVAVGHAGVLVYHGCRRRLVGRLAPSVIGRPRPYRVRDAVGRHLCAPEGLALLTVYLVGSFPYLPAGYRSWNGSVDWLAVAAQLVVVDALQYVAHRVEHRLGWLYRAVHKPHHRVTEPTLLDAYSGSVADTLAMVVVPLALTSRLVPSNLWSYAAFGSVYANQLVLIHSEFEHAWDGAARRLGIGTPRDHHQHHRDPRVNLGHILTWWDRLASTYRAGGDVGGLPA